MLADYVRLTGRDVQPEILIVEGNPCDYPDRFNRRMREIWQDLRRARAIVDGLGPDETDRSPAEAGASG